MKRSRFLVLGGCLVVLLIALLVGALGEWLLVVALAGLGLAVCEVVLHRALTTALPRQLPFVLAELYARVPLEQALLLVYVVGVPQLNGTTETVVVLAVVAHQVLRLAHSVAALVATRLAVPRAQLRNLGDSYRPGPSLAPLVSPRATQLLVAATGLPALGLLWAAVSGSFALVAPAAIAMALVAGAVVAAGVPALLTLIRRPRGSAVVRAAHEAVLRHRPEVVLYSHGIADEMHWVTTWLPTLDALERPALVMVRDPEVFSLLPPAVTPVVCLPDPRDVLPFSLPDARVALYVANARENIRLLRNPRLRSAFIGHGDSDKAASTSPLSKMYDEVWVAGEAARRRYLEADVGVRPEQIRIVGRPQVQRVQPGIPLEPGAPCSVLYAPTWEGLLGNATDSSLLHSGRDVVRGLLAVKGVRVLYRSHPTTGARNPRFLEAHQAILQELAAAGAPHAVVDAATTDLHSALNMADVLVTDVSSVISDFLASGKPYLVVNGTDMSESEFRGQFPSTAGAGVIGRGAEGLAGALADARGPDSMRTARERVRVQLIGPPTDDPVGLLSEAIDALGDTLRPRGMSVG
ncbi:CDP-Glycerol:Poly(glycerophosphate) glycerophosphotransferase [Modestobacter sp. DSM 44400]|uniref:CDP-glycerol glycerophosphotransferase family protein n=1 Tax=Modestobacter sp. DSM 44400 TaxID=1550230 RepID=UPI0008972D5F|nr:CDP-glycerol glycerophosphotransferase family protein [Modestobacter sp. DSM 44400]SDY79529.1 CDP-Glycerol:Poly(glycerophosphate) glycerophosphotransferase [Modestobacter sp. DSM 44400]